MTKARDLKPNQRIQMGTGPVTVTAITHRVVLEYRTDDGKTGTTFVDGDKEFKDPDQGALL